jgi:cytochrome b subunit of formate dehydrogenase
MSFKKEDMELIMVICLSIIFIAAVTGLVIWGWKRSLSNGASATQVMVGKKIGELCTSDAMCGTNKCRNNICII